MKQTVRKYENEILKKGQSFFHPSLNDINKIDLNVCFHDILNEMNTNENEEMNGICGNEHYRLLAYYSTLFDNSILLDIGTHKGKSALALSYNKSNTVISFDIVDNVDNRRIKTKENIEYNLENLWDIEIQNKWMETILNAPFIFLDVDPHNGTMEYYFYSFLKKINYKGILLCDDIWYFKEMRDNFWYKIPDKYRYDLTEYGHWSGTGIINFESIQSIIPPINQNRNKT
jgi:predicted O-methyltransferase YrrM